MVSLFVTLLRFAHMTEWDWASASGWCRMKAQELRKFGGCQRLDGEHPACWHLSRLLVACRMLGNTFVSHARCCTQSLHCKHDVCVGSNCLFLYCHEVFSEWASGLIYTCRAICLIFSLLLSLWNSGQMFSRCSICVWFLLIVGCQNLQWIILQVTQVRIYQTASLHKASLFNFCINKLVDLSLFVGFRILSRY